MLPRCRGRLPRLGRWCAVRTRQLGRNLENKLVADGVADGDYLLELLAHQEKGNCTCAFCDLESWHAFEHTARAQPRLPRTKNWLNANSAQVTWRGCHARRGFSVAVR